MAGPDEQKPRKAGQNLQKTAVIAALFGRTERRIQQLTQQGVLPAEETPQGRRYDLLPTIKRYITFLEGQIDKKSKSLEEKLEQKLDAEVKWKQAKADKSKLELDELKGTFHRAEDIEKLTNELVFTVRAMLLALPGRVAMDLASINTAQEVSAYMAKHVAYLLDDLAAHEYNPARYAELVREREGWINENNDERNNEDEDEDEDF